MKTLTKILKIPLNALKLLKELITGFLIRRWKELNDNDEKSPKESVRMETEKETTKEPETENKTNDKDAFEALKQELEALRKFKEGVEKKEKRTPLLQELKLNETEQKYINILLDSIDGDDDESKIKQLKKDLPQLFNKEEKSFDVKVEKLSDEEKKKINKIDPRELRDMGIGG